MSPRRDIRLAGESILSRSGVLAVVLALFAPVLACSSPDRTSRGGTGAGPAGDGGASCSGEVTCPEAGCTFDHAITHCAAGFEDDVDPRQVSHTVAPCGGFDVLSESTTFSGSKYFFEHATGKLVGEVSSSDDAGEAPTCSGPASFEVPAACDHAKMTLCFDGHDLCSGEPACPKAGCTFDEAVSQCSADLDAGAGVAYSADPCGGFDVVWVQEAKEETRYFFDHASGKLVAEVNAFDDGSGHCAGPPTFEVPSSCDAVGKTICSP